MEAIQNELKTLQEQRQRVEKDMASANETLQKAQRTLGEATSQRKEVATQIAPLEQLLKDITAIRSTTETQREATRREIEAAEKFHDELTKQINKELPAAHRKAIHTAIQAVDEAIDDLKKNVQALQQQMAKAKPAVTAAQKKTAPDQTLAQFRQLPGQIQTARGQVSHLSAAAKAAAASGRMIEALYLAGELKQVLDRLSKLIGKETETELVNRLEKEWQESKEAKKDIAALEKLKGDLATAEGELRSKIPQREADIKAALKAIEPAETVSPSQPTAQSTQPKADRPSMKADR